MPLHTAQDPSQIRSFSDVGEQFLVFYSSRDDAGRMWCPDCRDVEDLVERTFASADGPSALIIYVGQRHDVLHVGPTQVETNTLESLPWRAVERPINPYHHPSHRFSGRKSIGGNRDPGEISFLRAKVMRRMHDSTDKAMALNGLSATILILIDMLYCVLPSRISTQE
ncbi:hypothetical protein EVG20_g574 [Dentipellis fragilis]|uniref:Thioredoxin domain-containing protein n=1 Tax=Dentipellis fragilis TaxID=205917 RepID=A0A4Y9ZC49_9AGAM|nr:hypothetical protein EVG20_g574 [Dentipellis fragilis]